MADPAKDETVDLSESPIDRIGALCDEFKRRWKPNRIGDIQQCLVHANIDARTTLLRNLIQIDRQLRQGIGDEPSEDEYIALMPQYADAIREEFHESTQHVVQSILDTFSFVEDRKTDQQSSSVIRLGDFVLEKELGRGAMGIVYSARHVRHGTLVALKTLPNVSGQSLHRFKREFRSLADANHPNLVGLHKLQADAGQWFFTMDLIDGTDFLAHVRPNRQLDQTRLREALSQLVLGVNAVHVHKIVHRDIKPTNVMVTAEGQLFVMDFGLVLDVDTDKGGNQGFEVAGTPAYMAPEQIDLAEVSPASDWYAVGVMLYEALTGERPFRGSVQEVIRSKRTVEPAPILGNHPLDLIRLCDELLQRDPALRPDVHGIIKVVCPGDQQPSQLDHETIEDLLVGRDEQLTAIVEAIQGWEATDGSRVIFISGKSGEGKTALAERSLGRLHGAADCTLLAGRCYDRETLPFKALDTVVDALSGVLASMPKEEVQELLTPSVAVLAELFPVLNRVPSVSLLPRSRLGNLGLQQVRSLAVEALADILGRLGTKTQLVCFIDDLQWGDSDSAELLLEVLGKERAPKLLLIGTYRSDEADVSPFLNAWNQSKETKYGLLRQFDFNVAPLGLESCIELVTKIVGHQDNLVREYAQQIAEESGGNPLLLSELARCYDPKAISSHQLNLEEVMERKLSLLPADARQLLELVAVSGQALSVEEASNTIGHDTVPISTLARMRNERLLRNVGGTSTEVMDTYHDRIRETVLRDMSAPRRKELHVLLAEQIESSSQANLAGGKQDADVVNPRIYDLAYHFFEAEDSRAFVYQLQAGEAALEAYALIDGRDYLNRAKSIMPTDASNELRYRLHERLGWVNSRLADADSAVQSYESAIAVGGSKLRSARARAGIGQVYQQAGDLRQSLSNYDAALQELDSPRPQNILRVLLGSAGCMFRILFVPARWQRTRTDEAVARAELENHILGRCGYYLFETNSLQHFHACLRETIVASKTGRTDLLASAYSSIGRNLAIVSLHPLGRPCVKWAERLNQTSNNPDVGMNKHGSIGVIDYSAGKLEQAGNRFHDCIAYRNGDPTGLIMGYHMQRHVDEIIGSSEIELSSARTELEFATQANDRRGTCWGYYGVANALARAGDLEEAHEYMDRAVALLGGELRNVTAAICRGTHGYVLLQSSDYETARNELEASWTHTEKHKNFMDLNVRFLPLLIESIAGPNWLELECEDDKRRLKRLARFAAIIAPFFVNQRAPIQRARGRAYSALGNRRKAVRCFRRAIQLAASLGAEYQRARGILDLASVTEKGRDELRAEAIGLLKQQKSVLPRAESWLLGDLYDEEVVAPEFERQSEAERK